MKAPRVFVVDDEPVMVEVVTRLLDEAGYRTNAATDSCEALRRIRQDIGRFDVLITDNNMPALTGRELIERLRASGFRGKCIMYSGNIARDEESIYFASGADAVLHKPFDCGLLVPTVEKLCAS